MFKLGFKSRQKEIVDQEAFSAALLRHLVEIEAGKLSDSEYNAAVSHAVAAGGMQVKNGTPDLKHCSINYLYYVRDRILEACGRNIERVVQ